MEPRRFSKIIEKCPAERVKELARPIVEQHQVTVIRKPAKTLVMVRMRETVAKAEFYLGELLAAEAMVELEGAKGFSLLMGDDLDKAFSAAVLDALRRSQLPQWETVRLALERGQYAFGQVFTDNQASLALQRKVGMSVSRERLFWLF